MSRPNLRVIEGQKPANDCLACAKAPRRPGKPTCSTRCQRKLAKFLNTKFAYSFAQEKS